MVTTRAAGMAFATARAFQGGRMMSFDPLMESSGPPHASRERRSAASTARARAARADGGTRDQHSALSRTKSSDEYRPNNASARETNGRNRATEAVAARRSARMKGHGGEMNEAQRTTPRSAAGDSAASKSASGPEKGHPTKKKTSQASHALGASGNKLRKIFGPEPGYSTAYA